MKLILFGGIQGVGKTILLSWIENIFAGQITLLNPGELFRRYFYNEKIKTIEEIEELIVNKLEEMQNDSVAVLHWHYAVLRPTGYIPQINFSRLNRIVKSGKIEQVILLLVEAPVDAVLERRLADCRIKKRNLSLSVMREEIAAEEEFLIMQRDLFSQALGNHNIVVFRLTNIDLQATKRVLFNFFKIVIGLK